jgi:transcriptional regulator with XRE-family HTH domain
MNLGKAIKLCRNRKGMTQTALATKIGLSVPYLSQIENGQKDPTLSTVEKIANGLDVPINILFFLGSSRDEVVGLKPELAEKLSHLALMCLDKDD